MKCLGLANRGLGSLEAAADEKLNEAARAEAVHEGNQFYASCKYLILSRSEKLILLLSVTERARDKGVSISVITLKGKYLFCSKIISNSFPCFICRNRLSSPGHRTNGKKENRFVFSENIFSYSIGRWYRWQCDHRRFAQYS